MQGSQAGWTSTQSFTGLILGPTLILAFAAWEARAADPMIPLGIFRSATGPRRGHRHRHPPGLRARNAQSAHPRQR